MATAVVTSEKKTVTTSVDEKVVKLELTELEAKVLRSLVGCIGGNVDTTYRRETNSVRDALSGLGYTYNYRYFDASQIAKLRSDDDR